MKKRKTRVTLYTQTCVKFGLNKDNEITTIGVPVILLF